MRNPSYKPYTKSQRRKIRKELINAEKAYNRKIQKNRMRKLKQNKNKNKRKRKINL